MGLNNTAKAQELSRDVPDGRDVTEQKRALGGKELGGPKRCEPSKVASIVVALVTFTVAFTLWIFQESRVRTKSASWCGGFSPETTVIEGVDSFQGTMPTCLGKLTSLTKLSLFNDGVHGTIPTELGKLTELTYLGLHYNSLTGTVPTELEQLTNLSILRLDDNNLTGTVPLWVEEIDIVDVSGNNWTPMKSMPWCEGFHPETTVIEGVNSIQGTIPTCLGTLTSLTKLSLFNDGVYGTIPTELGKLTELTYLGLHYNSLTGTVPTELEQLTNLAVLRLDSNDLTGYVPVWVQEIDTVDVSFNNWTEN